MAVFPARHLPHVREGDGALTQLIMVVHEVEVLVVEVVDARLRGLVLVHELLTIHPPSVPLLDLCVARQQVARSTTLRCR